MQVCLFTYTKQSFKDKDTESHVTKQKNCRKSSSYTVASRSNELLSINHLKKNIEKMKSRLSAEYSRLSRPHEKCLNSKRQYR